MEAGAVSCVRNHPFGTGRTLDSILRREWGKQARFHASSDPSDPRAGTVVERADATGFRVLDTIAWVEVDDPQAGVWHDTVTLAHIAAHGLPGQATGVRWHLAQRDVTECRIHALETATGHEWSTATVGDLLTGDTDCATCAELARWQAEQAAADRLDTAVEDLRTLAAQREQLTRQLGVSAVCGAHGAALGCRGCRRSGASVVRGEPSSHGHGLCPSTSSCPASARGAARVRRVGHPLHADVALAKRFAHSVAQGPLGDLADRFNSHATSDATRRMSDNPRIASDIVQCCPHDRSSHNRRGRSYG